MFDEKMLRRVLLFFILVLLSSCRGEDAEKLPAEVKHFELQKSSFSALNGWENEKIGAFDTALWLKKRRKRLKANILNIL